MYDNLDRLSVYTKGNVSKFYDYDKNGNVMIRGKEFEYVGQKLVSYEGNTVTYDANGNITSYGSNHLTFE